MIGIHCNINKISEMRTYGFDAFQVFLINPQSLKIVKYDNVNQSIAGTHTYVHSSYLVSPFGSAKYNTLMTWLQLSEQAKLGMIGVVFHLPKLRPDEMLPYVKKIQMPKGARIIWEMRAMRPGWYETPEAINNLLETIPGDMCIDTAHLHASGQKIQTREQMQTWLKRLKYPERVRVIHINGSASTNHRDIHAPAFSKSDLIWHGIPFAKSGVQAIVDYAKKYKWDLIIESDFKIHQDDILHLYKLLKQKLY